MLSFIGDWSFWAVVIALMAYAEQTRRGRGRELWCRVLIDEPVLAIRPDLMGSLELRSRGRIVGSVHMLGFALVSAGGVPIRVEDFSGGVIIKTKGKGRILDVMQLREYKGWVQTDVDYDDTRIVVRPVLLNPNDSVALRLLIESFEKPMVMQVRIAGINVVPEAVMHPSDWWAGFRNVLAAAGVSVALGLAWRATRGQSGWLLVAGYLAGAGSFFAGLFLALNWLMELLPRHPRLARWGRNHREIEFHDAFAPGQGLSASMAPATHPGQLEVLAAHYGAGDRLVDVSGAVKARIDEGALRIRATNDLGGDPAPGTTKSLVVRYTLGGEHRTSEVREGEELALP